jgi:hypothetical protein
MSLDLFLEKIGIWNEKKGVKKNLVYKVKYYKEIYYIKL